jgi:exodeoxyribonuclease VII large subunit
MGWVYSPTVLLPEMRWASTPTRERKSQGSHQMPADGFFDVYSRVKAPAKDAAPTGPAPAALTVSQLTFVIEKAIKTGVPATVTVKGEVSNVSSRQASGHLYFTLKDPSTCINAIMWRDAAERLVFKLHDGMEVIATGRVAVYGPQGRYQLQAQRLDPVGKGALELAFRQLQAKLAAEGLFDPGRKKPVPLYPERIVLITSQATAALQDMLKIFRQFPWLRLMVYHVPVQGEGAGAKIAQAIAHLNQQRDLIGRVDAIVLGRGGGSLEDLWAFNEGVVARAVAASSIPIVTGIGHETDCSIADLVADYHAHTPTEAARIVTENWKNAAEALAFSHTRLHRALKQTAQSARERLASIARHEVFRRPLDRIQMLRQLLDDRQKSALLGLQARFKQATQSLAAVEPRLRVAVGTWSKSRVTHLDALERQLEMVSPVSVLRRGYTITTLKKTGQILKSAAGLKPGDRLMTRFAEGESESIVEDSRQMNLFE